MLTSSLLSGSGNSLFLGYHKSERGTSMLKGLKMTVFIRANYTESPSFS